MMFDLEYKKNDHCEVDGKSIQNLMQNKETPILDLFVRESIQNSLDAAASNVNHVEVRFQTGSFNVQAVSGYFDGINKSLLNLYGNTANFLAFADKNTKGLTGNLDGCWSKNDSSEQNLGKLVFHILKPQTKEGAGGSWGIGKTLFFTMGIGLVSYYSRILLDDGTYQERLASTLIEDPDKDESRRLLPISDCTGVAFWGKRKSGTADKVQAITDQKVIHLFLREFGISPYTNNETGTCVIIPFINKNYLCQHNAEEDEHLWWKNSLEHYLHLSILRWYFPRLVTEYKKIKGIPHLQVFVNNNKIEPSQQAPFFVQYTDLFRSISSKHPQNGIQINKITRDRNLEDDDLGTLIFKVYSLDELGCYNNLPSPNKHALIPEDKSERNYPIVAFCRQPGMIVNYTTITSVPNPPDKQILGIFVLNSKNNIVSPCKLPVEEYFRSGEKSDHIMWYDHEIMPGCRLVKLAQHISNHVSEIIKQYYDSSSNEASGATHLYRSVSTTLASKLFPEFFLGDGTNSRVVKDPPSPYTPGRSPKKRKTHCEANLQKIYFLQNCIELEYNVQLDAQTSDITCTSNIIDNDGRNYSCSSWEERGLSYPLQIEKMAILYNETAHVFDPTVQNIDTDFTVTFEKDGKKCSSLKIACSANDIEFLMKIRLSSTDKHVSPSIEITFGNQK